MPPIRKGDGTRLVPDGISQVRTGDGRILFDRVAIPDSELDYDAHYAAHNIEDEYSDGETVDPWTDITANVNLPVVEGAPVFEEDVVNGLPAVSYDGDLHRASISTSSQPNVAISVLIPRDTVSDQWVWTFADSAQHQLNIGFDFSGEFSLQNDLGGIPVSTEPLVLTQIWDGSESLLRLNGDQESTGSISSENADAIALGGRGSGLDGNDYDGYIAEHGVVFDRPSDSEITDEEQRLLDIYGIE